LYQIRLPVRLRNIAMKIAIILKCSGAFIRSPRNPRVGLDIVFSNKNAFPVAAQTRGDRQYAHIAQGGV
jgi:hypothetical protein